MTRDDLPRDPLLSDAFQVMVRQGATAAEPDGLVSAVRARVRRRRTARRVGAGATGLAVVAAAALAVPHVLPGDGPGQRGPAGTPMVQTDYPVVHTLDELLERADVVVEGRVLAVQEEAPAEAWAPPTPTGPVDHPGGDDLSVGWYCAAWDGSSQWVTRHYTKFGILGVSDEEADVVWEQVEPVLQVHCAMQQAAHQESAAAGVLGDDGGTRGERPPFLLVGPDVNDLDLAVRLDPGATIHDLCPETDEKGSPTDCSLRHVIEPFRAAFPTFEVDDDCSIRRLEPAAPRPGPEPASDADDPDPVTGALRLVTLLVDTVHVGEVPASAVVVVQTVGSAWEPPLQTGGRYLIFGEFRDDGRLTIVGGSAGGFADDGLGGWLPLLPASSPVRHLSAAQLAALLAGEGEILPGDEPAGD